MQILNPEEVVRSYQPSFPLGSKIKTIINTGFVAFDQNPAITPMLAATGIDKNIPNKPSNDPPAIKEK